MAQLRLVATERRGFLWRNFNARSDELEEPAVRRLAEQFVSPVGNGVTHAALDAMAVVVEHLFEGTFVNDRLPALEGRSLLAFERLDRHRAKLDPLHRAPRLRIKFHDRDAVESRANKRLQKCIPTTTRDHVANPPARVRH